MVLAGIVNKSLVAAIAGAGQPAIGLCGGDGGVFRARKKNMPEYDLGFVGEICFSEPRWLKAIWAEGGIPVLVVVGAGGRWRILQRERRSDGGGVRGGLRSRCADFSDRRARRESSADGAVMPWLDTKRSSGLIRRFGGRAAACCPKLEACTRRSNRAWAACGSCRRRRRNAAACSISPSWNAERRYCAHEPASVFAHRSEAAASHVRAPARFFLSTVAVFICGIRRASAIWIS